MGRLLYFFIFLILLLIFNGSDSATVKRKATSTDSLSNSDAVVRGLFEDPLNRRGAESAVRVKRDEDDEPGCSGCSLHNIETDMQTIRQRRLESVKQLILRSLRLSDRPNITVHRNQLPSTVLESAFSIGSSPISNDVGHVEFETAASTDTSQVIVFAESDEGTYDVTGSMNTDNVVMFPLRESLSRNRNVDRGQVWFYVTTNDDMFGHTFNVYALSNGTDDVIEVASKHVQFSSGWISFDIISVLAADGVLSAQTALVLEVRCVTCATEHTTLLDRSDERRKPFLSVLFGYSIYRQRRSVDCTPGLQECCRQQFYVSFEELGWDDWIIHPLGYMANYCTGSCDGTVLPTYYHTNIMQHISTMADYPDPLMRDQIVSCCTPTRLSTISMIYFNPDSYIMKNNIPNMSVETCGCS